MSEVRMLPPDSAEAAFRRPQKLLLHLLHLADEYLLLSHGFRNMCMIFIAYMQYLMVKRLQHDKNH